MSAVCHGRSAREIAAAINSSMRFVIFREDKSMLCLPAKRGVKYRVYRERLSHRRWQVLILADTPELLTSDSDEALWQAVRSDRFTTPVLREWMPWLRYQLRNSCLLSPLVSDNCQGMLLHATTDDLDRTVGIGLNLNKITIGDE